MKEVNKRTLIFPLCLLLLTLLLPCGTLLFSFFGYTFTLASYIVFSLLTALLALADALWATHIRKQPCSWTELLLRVFALLFSAVNPLFYLVRCCNAVVALCMLLSFGFCCYTAILRSKHFLAKALCLFFGLFTPVPLCLFLLFILTFGNLGEDTVVRTVDSPDGTYQAQLIESSQGALGGDTLVCVKDKTGDHNLLVFKLSKNPKIVYIGAWWEHETLSLSWKNEECLLINEQEYPIK